MIRPCFVVYEREYAADKKWTVEIGGPWGDYTNPTAVGDTEAEAVQKALDELEARWKAVRQFLIENGRRV